MSGERALLLGKENESDIPEQPADRRMVLVGKTGSGKSAAGNTILGIKCFESKISANSVTKRCQIGQGEFTGKTISVTDTPGVCDKDLTEKDLTNALESCIYLTVPGPHVFLLVIRVGVRYNREEQDAMKWIRDSFGIEAQQYAIVLFTHTDELTDMTLKQYVNESSELKDLVRACGGRFHGFNNRVANPTQVNGLLKIVDRMVGRNRLKGRDYYTDEKFKKAQNLIQKARRIKMAKEVAVGTATAVGTGVAVGGGITLAVTELVAVPALLIVGGAMMAGKAGYDLIKKQIDKNK